MLSKPLPILESNAPGGTALSGRLAVLGYRVMPAADLDDLSRLAREHQAAGVVLELRALGPQVRDAVGRVRSAATTAEFCIVVVDDARSPVGPRVEALEAGADLVIHSSIDDAELAAQLRAQFSRTRLPLRFDDSGSIKPAGAGAATDLSAYSNDLRPSASDMLVEAQRVGKMGTWEMDLVSNRLRWSVNTCALFGVDSGTFDGRFETFRSLVLPEDWPAQAAHIHAADTQGTLIHNEYRVRRPDGEVRWLYERGQVMRDPAGLPVRRAGVVLDIHERKTAELKVVRLNRVYAILSEFDRIAAAAGDTTDLFEAACRLAVQKGDAVAAWVGIIEGSRHDVRVIARADARDGYLNRFTLPLSESSPVNGGPFWTAVGSGLSVVCSDTARDPAFEPWREAALQHGFRSAGVFPIKIEGKVEGAFVAYAGLESYFDADEVRLYEEFAWRLSIAVESLERGERLRDAEAARNVAVEQLRGMFEQAAVGIWIADTEQSYQRSNSRFSTMLGFTGDAGLQWQDDLSATHPDDRANDAAAIERLRGGGASVTHEKRYLTAAGRALWCEVTISSLRRGDGTDAGFIGIVVDITQRRHDLAQLRLLQTCIARVNDLVVITEAEPIVLPGPKIVYVNDAFERRMGYRRDELIGRTPRLLQGPKTQPDTLRHIRENLQQWQPVRAELINYTKSGEEVWLELEIVPVADADGWFTHWISIERDVTERMRSMQALTDAQSLLKMASSLSRLGAWRYDVAADGPICSEALCAIAEVPPGYRPGLQEALGFFPAESRESIFAAFEQCLGRGATYDLEVQFVTLTGRTLWVRTMGEPVRDAAGTIVGVQGALQDVTGLRRAQEALKLSEERFRLLSSATNDAIWDWDLHTDSWWWSDSAAGFFPGEAGPRGRSYADFARQVHPQDRARVINGLDAAIAGADAQWTAALRLARTDGTFAYVQSRAHIVRDPGGGAVRVLGGISDVTERINLEDRLRQSQRLEAVGQLTGGVAHDFNNLLTVIMGNSDLLVEELAGIDPSLSELAQMILIAAKRGEDLTQRLLSFARRQALDPRAVNVDRLVKQLEPLLQRTLGKHIDIRLFNRPDLSLAMVDPGQIENALLNLCLNSRDAMPEGGQLTIETCEVQLDAKYAEQHPECVAGRYVMLAVSDTGTGIPPENLRRVFEPFFTTKGKGGGTGLGLAMVYGFVRQSEGHVTIYSEPGQGTTVRMYLKPAREGLRLIDEPGESVPQATAGSETILLVEDDDLVRVNAQRVLAGNGYTVLEASSGPQALETIRSREDIDLLFTDVVMPGGMNGRDLADKARQLRPCIKVLYTSGYTENAIVHHGRLDPGVHLLSKPYRRDELLRRIRALLDGAGAGPT